MRLGASVRARAFLVSLGRLQALGRVQILAVDLHGDFAVIRYAVGFAVDRVGVAPGFQDVFVLEPGRVRQAGVIQVTVERLDPLVGHVQRVVHRVCGMRCIGACLRRQVQRRLLPDLPRRHFFHPHLDAGQGLELRQQRAQVVEIAGGDDSHRDRFAFGLTPVDLRALVRRKIVALRQRATHQRRRQCQCAECCGGADQLAPAGLRRAAMDYFPFHAVVSFFPGDRRRCLLAAPASACVYR